MSMKDLFWKDPNPVKTNDGHKNGQESKKLFETHNSEQAPSILLNVPSGNREPTNILTGTAGKKEEYVKYFDDIIEKNNIPGPDYFEFAKALEKKKNDPMDEKTKFGSIFAGFDAMGVTKEKLVETAKVYITIVDNEKTKFDQSCQDAVNGKIKNEEQKAIKLEEENKNIEQQMVELTAKKIANIEEAKKIREANSNRVNQLTAQKADFDSAYLEKSTKINHDIELINLYL